MKSQRRVHALILAAGAVTLAALAACRESTPPANAALNSPSVSEAAASDSPAEADVPSAVPAANLPPQTGKQLYAAHCAACHGEAGDGKGLAAPFLFPKPRDLLAGNFRLVSTDNNVPTREDLHAVLSRGMPGSAMPPWGHLSQQDRDALVDEILRLRQQGTRDAYVRSLKENEGLTDEDIAAEDVQAEIQQHVDDFTAPGASTEVPEIPPSTPEAVARGKAIYAQFACASCHGATGKGDGVEAMADIEQMPTSPRDFTLGIFKGSPDPEALYRRIAYGMPGTPMPGSSSMTAEQRVDLVHYVRSLSTESQREAAILNREKIVATRVPELAALYEDAAWKGAKPVTLRMAPLWWRNVPDSDVQVQALHDGQALAVRLTWRDGAEDRHSIRSETFEDAAAMQVFRGQPEPFLGMGSAASPVDVWFWDADRQGPSPTVEEHYPNMAVDQYPFSEATATSTDRDRPGARTADQPDLSLPARAAGNLIVPQGDESGGSSLHVGGPGSVTFRLPQSQVVEAHGAWKNGQWTVVMQRPLSVAESDGLSLEVGGNASVAFAIWDGGSRDRDGQKLITVWQDLELAK
jgi:mono/diheme cytochrome c family protein